jgi:hypothetical protein
MIQCGEILIGTVSLGYTRPFSSRHLSRDSELRSRREHTCDTGNDLDPERRLAPQLGVQMDELGQVGFDSVALDVLLLLMVLNCGALWEFFTPLRSVQNDNMGHVFSELLTTGSKEICESYLM